MHGIIEVTSAMTGSAWKWLKSPKEVAAKNAVLKKAGRDAELLVFASVDEKRDPPEELVTQKSSLLLLLPPPPPHILILILLLLPHPAHAPHPHHLLLLCLHLPLQEREVGGR